MKFRNLLFIGIAVLLSFGSCNRDDVDLIVGTWKHYKMEIDIETTDPALTDSVQNTINMLKEAIRITMVFRSHGFYDATISMLMPSRPGLRSITTTGNYSLENGKLLIDEVPFVYELSKNRLILRYYSEGDFGLPTDILDGIIDLPAITKLNVSIWFDRR